jgi:hypothetical protein
MQWTRSLLIWAKYEKPRHPSMIARKNSSAFSFITPVAQVARMKTRLLLSLLCCLCAATAFAQTPRILWSFDTRDASFGQTAAGDIDGDGRLDLLAGAPGEASGTGAAYFVRGLPGAALDLAQGAFLSRIAPAGAGAQTGSAVAVGPGNALVAAPGVSAAYLVTGSGWPAAAPVAAAPAAVPPAPLAVEPVKPCRATRPRAKGAKAKPATCPLRTPAKAKPRARGGHARTVK